MTQIPLYNVNNNCSTGSTGLFMARQFCASGLASAVLVVGFEKMFPGSLQNFFKDRTNPLDKSYKIMQSTRGVDSKAPGAAQLFGNAGKEYKELYGATDADFAEIARVNHAHSARNPYSQFKDVYTLEQILGSAKVWDPLTKLQCCPTSDGAAAAVVVSQSFIDAHPELASRAILIAGQGLATDSPALYSGSAIDLVGYQMTAAAVRTALSQANTAISDIGLIELHDCFSANEMVTIDGLGLCEKGKAHEYVRAGNITYGGKTVINPSGGLISKGHPLGATGLAQCAELVWHLRGWAGERNVEGVKAALQHNLGLGGAAVVTVYKRPDGSSSKKVVGEAERIGGRGYNPATEARGLSEKDIELAVSRKAKSAYMGKEEKKEARL